MVVSRPTANVTCILQEMLEKIKKTAAETVDAQCFVLIILSHGDTVNNANEVLGAKGERLVYVTNEEVVFGTDGGHLSKTKIVEELSSSNRPNLRGVPRLVFFQCCRGSTVESLLRFLYSVVFAGFCQ